MSDCLPSQGSQAASSLLIVDARDVTGLLPSTIEDLDQKIEQIEGQLLGLNTKTLREEASRDREDRLQKFALCQDNLTAAASFYENAVLEAYPNHHAQAKDIVMGRLPPTLIEIFRMVEKFEDETVFKDICRTKAEEMVKERIALRNRRKELMVQRAWLTQMDDPDTEQLVSEFDVDRNAINLLLQISPVCCRRPDFEPYSPSISEEHGPEFVDVPETNTESLSKENPPFFKSEQSLKADIARLKDQLEVLKTDVANKDAVHKSDRAEIVAANGKVKTLKNQLQARANITHKNLKKLVGDKEKAEGLLSKEREEHSDTRNKLKELSEKSAKAEREAFEQVKTLQELAARSATPKERVV